ncbi:MAG: DUF3578 domain-containing protein [Bacteroidales bacterium]|nr:DUF3578 domain-containing protein [Bacteroidales bacterium]
MSIPSNITKEHIIKALNEMISEGVPKNGNSSTYDVLYNNHLLPPKVIVSIANKYANGVELDRNSFEGGRGTESFKLLEKNDFIIIEKGSYYPELKMFLEQAQAGDLKTKHFKNDYLGLKVKVSFGQGGIAKVPWISFLAEGQTTSNGIYPVYLFYKSINRLILAYGISETNIPSIKWDVSEKETSIDDFFREQSLGKPARYGDSYIYKDYDLNQTLNPSIFDKDLKDLLSIYNKQVQKEVTVVHKEIFEKTSFNYKSFEESALSSGLLYSEKLIQRFSSSLVSKPFVILSGLSGSGKTKLAQAFTQWICQDDSQYCIVPVGADWTNREPLLGYPNALKTDEYIKPDNRALDVILNANNHPDLPYFLILDEMNLSHVERYFADFLSVMESGEEIALFAEDEKHNGVPSKLGLPSNLFIIGTVNIDETTYMFSPKVLDRANAIEFRVSKEEIEEFLNFNKGLDMKLLNSKGASMAKSFLDIAQNKDFKENDMSEVNKTLVSFFEQLKKTGAEFGYRSASEIHRLINQLSVIEPTISEAEKVDIAIVQKLLPKLHGSRRKLCPILIVLGGFCVTKEISNVEKEVFDNEDFNFNDTARVKYPLSLEKIARMYKGAVDNGFASYAEA